MVSLKFCAGQTIARHKLAIRPNHPGHFREEAVLERRGRHVVQHGERDRPAETAIREIERGRIPFDDHHRSMAGETVRQQGRQLGVDLYGRQLGDRFGQYVSGGAVSRAYLQDVVAEIGVPKGPGQDGVTDHSPPLVAAALTVVLVHAFRRLVGQPPGLAPCCTGDLDGTVRGPRSFGAGVAPSAWTDVHWAPPVRSFP